MCFLVVCMMSYIGLGHTANKKLCGRALPRAVYVVCGLMKRGGAPTLHQRPSAPGKLPVESLNVTTYHQIRSNVRRIFSKTVNSRLYNKHMECLDELDKGPHK